MRLGIVMCGAGVHAACCAGVMAALYRRHAEPYAVSGIDAGAWPAALFMAGLTPQEQWQALEQAAHCGKRLLRGSLLPKRGFLCEGRRMSALLGAQCRHKLLAACPGAGVLLCRAQRSGRLMLFSSAAYPTEDGAMLIQQTSVSFAARAAMSVPPFLAPMEYMGQALLPSEDIALACHQLRLLGAHRVLVILPQISCAHRPDALEMTVSQRVGAQRTALPEYAAILPVHLPDGIGALQLNQMMRCAEVGEACAEKMLEGVLWEMGVSGCRVLPFRRAVR